MLARRAEPNLPTSPASNCIQVCCSSCFTFTLRAAALALYAPGRLFLADASEAARGVCAGSDVARNHSSGTLSKIQAALAGQGVQFHFCGLSPALEPTGARSRKERRTENEIKEWPLIRNARQICSALMLMLPIAFDIGRRLKV